MRQRESRKFCFIPGKGMFAPGVMNGFSIMNLV
jgi:hypothetical protein